MSELFSFQKKVSPYFWSCQYKNIGVFLKRQYILHILSFTWMFKITIVKGFFLKTVYHKYHWYTTFFKKHLYFCTDKSKNMEILFFWKLNNSLNYADNLIKLRLKDALCKNVYDFHYNSFSTLVAFTAFCKKNSRILFYL